MTTPGQDLGREEWDFESIPMAEAEFCLRYELAREVRAPQTYFPALTSAQISAAKLEKCLAPSKLADRPNSTRTTLLFSKTYLAQASPLDKPATEFPERGMIPGVAFLHPDNTFHAVPDFLRNTPFSMLERSWRSALSDILNASRSGYRSTPLTEAPSKCRPNGANAPEIFQTFINWRKTDAALTEDFRNWLRVSRPSGQPAEKEVGRQSVLDRLRALSAMRLRHRYLAVDAIEWTRQKVGRALYSEPFAWDRAAARGIELFRTIYPNAGLPRAAEKQAAPRGRPAMIVARTG